jgi:hypothetical protein
MKLNLTREEVALALSTLTYDTQGRHGDGRGEAIASLIKKIKRERARDEALSLHS